MGEVRTNILIQNFEDITLSKKGYISKKDIRSVELDALADTGSVKLLLPQDVVETLGLEILEKVIVILSNEEKIELPYAGYVRVKVCNRMWTGACLVGPPLCETLFGQIIMEDLDLVINPLKGIITVNPASPFLGTFKLK